MGADRALRSQTRGNSHTQCDGAKRPSEPMAQVGRSTGTVVSPSQPRSKVGVKALEVVTSSGKRGTG